MWPLLRSSRTLVHCRWSLLCLTKESESDRNRWWQPLIFYHLALWFMADQQVRRSSESLHKSWIISIQEAFHVDWISLSDMLQSVSGPQKSDKHAQKAPMTCHNWACLSLAETQHYRDVWNGKEGITPPRPAHMVCKPALAQSLQIYSPRCKEKKPRAI